MKKFFLLIAAVSVLSLTSCGGGETSSAPDGNSQVTSIDPNDPNQMPPQMNEASAVEAEQSISNAVEQKAPEGKETK